MTDETPPVPDEPPLSPETDEPDIDPEPEPKTAE
jgi:hypothetical protein